jgi:hypothetical protein
MEMAEVFLDISQIVDIEDLIAVKKDEKVVFTYISLFKEKVISTFTIPHCAV